MKLNLSKEQAVFLRLLLTEERENRVKRALNMSVGLRHGPQAVVEEIDKILKQLPEVP